jgi:hypothetical protein
MAFNRLRLALIGNDGNSDAPRLWAYKTDDTAATVDTVGYFAAARQILKVGDHILRVTVTNLGLSNEAYATSGLHAVSQVDSTTVDVNDALVVTATDTD